MYEYWSILLFFLEVLSHDFRAYFFLEFTSFFLSFSRWTKYSACSFAFFIFAFSLSASSFFLDLLFDLLLLLLLSLSLSLLCSLLLDKFFFFFLILLFSIIRFFLEFHAKIFFYEEWIFWFRELCIGRGSVFIVSGLWLLSVVMRMWELVFLSLLEWIFLVILVFLDFCFEVIFILTFYYFEIVMVFVLLSLRCFSVMPSILFLTMKFPKWTPFSSSLCILLS